MQCVYRLWRHIQNLNVMCGTRSRWISLMCFWSKSMESLRRVRNIIIFHDAVIKWKHFPCYWPCVRRIHRSLRGFDVFFDLRVNTFLSKESKHWWFETPSRSLWRHCNMYCRKIIDAPIVILMLITLIAAISSFFSGHFDNERQIVYRDQTKFAANCGKAICIGYPRFISVC